jgi:hypothetical protein
MSARRLLLCALVIAGPVGAAIACIDTSHLDEGLPGGADGSTASSAGGGEGGPGVDAGLDGSVESGSSSGPITGCPTCAADAGACCVRAGVARCEVDCSGGILVTCASKCTNPIAACCAQEAGTEIQCFNAQRCASSDVCDPAAAVPCASGSCTGPAPAGVPFLKTCQ